VLVAIYIAQVTSYI